MEIKTIVKQNKRDFTAVYECEYCGYTYKGYGYDDTYFHNTVIPDMTCGKCGKKSKEGYKPRIPKYPDNELI